MKKGGSKTHKNIIAEVELVIYNVFTKVCWKISDLLTNQRNEDGYTKIFPFKNFNDLSRMFTQNEKENGPTVIGFDKCYLFLIEG